MSPFIVDQVGKTVADQAAMLRTMARVPGRPRAELEALLAGAIELEGVASRLAALATAIRDAKS